jgi:hypothetical protein
MISFLNPIFLWALAALSIPLILHFIQSSRTERLPFSTVRFLKIATKRSSRRIKMENFLLMLLRFLLLTLLALAFAMPIVRTKKFGKLLSGTARDVAIVIDGSYSMNYEVTQQVIWNQAVELATTIVEGLGDNDKFCVYLAGDQVTPVYEQMTDKKEEAVARLKALSRPPGSSKLAPAVMAALDALERDSRRGERELHIISDFQALPWESFRADTTATARAEESSTRSGAQAMMWEPTEVSDNTTCFVTLLGAPEPENTAVTDIELKPPLITAGMPCQVTARVLRSGPEVESAVSLVVDDAEVVRRSVTLGEGGADQIQFVLPALNSGVHAAKIETAQDSLKDDDLFYFLIRVREHLPVLCVGDQGGTVFLKTALDADGGSDAAINAALITPEELSDEKLRGCSCVFLCNSVRLSGQQIKLVEKFVAAGGLLVVMPGDRSTIEDYALWSILPAEPTAIVELPVARRKQLLTWDKPQHPVLWEIAEKGVNPSLVVKRRLRFGKIGENSETIISIGAGEPFLVAREHGRGAVLLCAVAADRTWSDFPLSPYFLPLMHQLCQYAASIGAGHPYLWADASISLAEHLPEAGRDSAIVSPEGKPIVIRTSVAESGEVLTYAEGVWTPGHYTLRNPGDAAAQNALAVNMPRRESELTALTAQDISEILGIAALHVAVGRDDLLKKIEDFRIGRSLGETLLWLALLVAVAEVFYSNFLLRKNCRLTDKLKVAPSGRVKEKQV